MWSGLRPPPFTVTQPVPCLTPYSWIVIAATMVTIIFVFDPLGGKMAPYPPCIPEHLDSNNTNQLLTGLKTAAKSVWETRVQCCCCCVGQDDNTRVAFSSTADLFSTYFSVSGRNLLWSLSRFCQWVCGTMGVCTKPCEPPSCGVEDLYPLGVGFGRQQLTARMAKPFLLLVCFALRLSLLKLTVAEALRELLTLLLLPAPCWVCRRAPPCQVYLLLRVEPKASCI